MSKNALKCPFKAGDLVTLKSGGPTMTVGGVREDGMVDAIYFDEAYPREMDFPFMVLKKAEALEEEIKELFSLDELRDKLGEEDYSALAEAEDTFNAVVEKCNLNARYEVEVLYLISEKDIDKVE